MNEDIKAGQVVTLKSGGPKMTVSDVSKDQATCFWFENGALNIKAIPVTALTTGSPQ